MFMQASDTVFTCYVERLAFGKRVCCVLLHDHCDSEQSAKNERYVPCKHTLFCSSCARQASRVFHQRMRGLRANDTRNLSGCGTRTPDGMDARVIRSFLPAQGRQHYFRAYSRVGGFLAGAWLEVLPKAPYMHIATCGGAGSPGVLHISRGCMTSQLLRRAGARVLPAAWRFPVRA